jgi:hypothetical protein
MMTHRVRAFSIAFLLAALLNAGWFFWSNRDVPHFGFLLDDALYHTVGKSLASGGGHRIESLPGAPAQTKYPPLYPLILSAVWRAAPDFPAHLSWALAVNAAAFLVYCALLPLLFRGLGIAAPWDVFLTAAVALNPPAIFYASSLMSETVAAPLLTLLLITAPSRPALAGLLAGASVLVRSASIILLASAPFWYSVRRQWKSAALFLAASLPCTAAWILWSSAHRASAVSPELRYYVDYFGYLASSFDLSALPRVVNANFGTLVTSIGGLLWFDATDSPTATYAKTVLTLLAVAGICKPALRSHVFTVFAFSYVAVLLPWNFSPNERFLLPLLPLLLAGLFTSMREIVGSMMALFRKPGVANQAFAAVALAAVGSSGLYWLSAQLEAAHGYLPALLQRERERRALELPAYAWVRANLPAGAAAIAYQESRFYLFTGRRAIGMPLPSRLGYSHDRPAIAAYFAGAAETARANGVRYLYVTPWDFELDLGGPERNSRVDALRNDPAWREIYSANGFSVFELRSPGSLSRLPSTPVEAPELPPVPGNVRS